MINKEHILQTAQSLVQQYNLPLKIKGVGEETEVVVIYFSADERVRLRELTQELEAQLNLPIKLERLKKSETGKIGGVDILGNYPCCASFLRHCPFAGKYGCGYGFGKVSESQGVKVSGIEEKPATTENAEKSAEAQKREKRKRKKVVRRVVLKG